MRTNDGSSCPTGRGGDGPLGPLRRAQPSEPAAAALPRGWSDLPTLGGGFTPLADLEETDDAYLVEIELPGVKRDDVAVEVAGRRLTVSGERKERQRVGILRRRTRTVGRFHYEVVLPGDVEEEGVTASMEEGVLTLRVPKPASERPRRIAVT